MAITHLKESKPEAERIDPTSVDAKSGATDIKAH